MDEIAYGLEMAGCLFIWAVRSGTWASDEGWERRVEGRGLVVCDWVDQRSILAHPKVAGFLSHCGGTRCWRACQWCPSIGLANGSRATTECQELMGGEKGRRARERAGLFGTMARHAVEKGGSSDKKLDELIKCLIANKKE
ncbi:unnamed protein product [Prunus armeniaca]